MQFVPRSRGAGARRGEAPSLFGLALLQAAATVDLAEADRRDDELFSAPHGETTRWGADRFALEFRRREEEERRHAAAERWNVGPGPVAGEKDPVDAAMEAITHGPVAAEVAGSVVEPLRDELDLRPARRHPHVPRAPIAEPPPEPVSRRRRRRRREPAGEPPTPIPATAWLSPGARRLYGLKDPPTPRVDR